MIIAIKSLSDFLLPEDHKVLCTRTLASAESCELVYSPSQKKGIVKAGTLQFVVSGPKEKVQREFEQIVDGLNSIV